jgi:hypothetical protein
MSIYPTGLPNVIATQNDVIIPRHVLVPPEVVPVSTGPTPGLVNPVSRATTRKYVNINTSNRTRIAGNGTLAPALASQSTNCILSLPTPVKGVISITPVALNLPNAPYSISAKKGTNVFWIAGKDADLEDVCPHASSSAPSGTCIPELDIAWRPIVVPDGNYTGTQLVAYLNKLLASPVFVFSPTSCRIGIASTKPVHLLFALDTPLDTTLGWIMGFRDRYYLISEEDILAIAPTHGCSGDGLLRSCTIHDGKFVSAVFAEATYSAFGSGYMMLCIDDYQANVDELYLEEPGITRKTDRIGAQQNSLARIDVDFTYRQEVCEITTTIVPSTRNYFGPVTLNKLRIMLIDQSGAQVDLSNGDFSLTLEMECLYRV